ncbi:hypothetical protein D1BOALGB6SA_7289 [Olavius sp. associated proteobacterium Delta 1]|nr:hypothetical protein D1BOALGB6SA_7289 [Olavius sp. associated proteobacterium Delta 1]
MTADLRLRAFSIELIHRIRERHVVDEFHKADHVTAGTAAEALS